MGEEGRAVEGGVKKDDEGRGAGWCLWGLRCGECCGVDGKTW